MYSNLHKDLSYINSFDDEGEKGVSTFMVKLGSESVNQLLFPTNADPLCFVFVFVF